MTWTLRQLTHRSFISHSCQSNFKMIERTRNTATLTLSRSYFAYAVNCWFQQMCCARTNERQRGKKYCVLNEFKAILAFKINGFRLVLWLLLGLTFFSPWLEMLEIMCRRCDIGYLVLLYSWRTRWIWLAHKHILYTPYKSFRNRPMSFVLHVLQVLHSPFSSDITHNCSKIRLWNMMRNYQKKTHKMLYG